MDNYSDKESNFLPDDCLIIIFKKLQNNISDQNAFGLTCKQWFNIQNSIQKSLIFGPGQRKKISRKHTTYVRRLISRYSTLEYISFSGCKELTYNTLIKSGINFQYLKSLSLKGCHYITDYTLTHFFAKLPHLTSVTLDFCNITDLGLKSLAKNCTQLRNVSVSSCELVTDAGITALLGKCIDICALNVSYLPHMTGFVFENFARNWSYIIADTCWISYDYIVETLGPLGLESLSLKNDESEFHIVFNQIETEHTIPLRFLDINTIMDDYKLCYFCNMCPLLEEMNLEGTRRILYADAWSRISEKCKNLRVLNANSCRIEDKDLMKIAKGCERLEVIYLRDCEKITEGGLKNFKAFRPDVEVKIEECLSIGPHVTYPFA